MSRRGRLAIVIALASVTALRPNAAPGRDRPVASVAEIAAAIDTAEPGDVITLAPGVYELPRTVIRRSGRPGRPITLRGSRPGAVELRSRATELFKISAADWVFEDLDIAGVCRTDAECEHAFHIVGRADRTVIRRNRVRDFNAHIKGNGEGGDFPSEVRIEDNTLFDTYQRRIEQPLVTVDVVGGRDWVVRGNLIADFGKVAVHPPRRADDYGYAVFLKGNSSRGLIERNIVACGLVRPPTPFTRGISLGGSGTDPGLCDTSCATEHRDGTIRDNFVVDCPGEPGVYLYKAGGSRVSGNAIADTAGILAEAPETTATITGNTLSGRIAAVDGAAVQSTDNVVTGSSGATRAADADLCGRLRQSAAGTASPQAILDDCRAATLAIAGYRKYVASLLAHRPARP